MALEHNHQRCSNCLISVNFPGIRLDDEGVCNQCREYEKLDYDNQVVKSNEERILEIIDQRKGKSSYDVIVAYSGGKDSSFTLHYLKKELKLNVLALLIDNDFISETAFVNARRLTSALSIDMIIFKPEADFMHTLYKKSIESDNLYNKSQLTRANAACLSCINLINNIALNEALIRKIPLIAGGYIGGQIPDKSGVVRIDQEMMKELREKNRSFLAQNIDERFNHYLKKQDLSDDQIYPVLINPLLGLQYEEDEIIKVISEYGWKKPMDTGKSSSNCLLNDFAIAVHYEKYKYHSYEAEICLQVRRGSMSKEEALEKLEDIRPSSSFKEVKSKLSD